MRVLVVHNRYSSHIPSGENLSVRDEVDALGRAGVDVHLHTVSNDDALGASRAQRVQQAAWAAWSLPAQRQTAALVDRIRPDIVHVHNLFPLLTASVPWAAVRRRVPVVWTVRNQRITCVDGTHFRDGQPCHLCRPGWRVPGIVHRCYRQSLPASLLVTGATSIFRAVARRHVTAVTISRHLRDWLVDQAGLPADRVRVKYNGVAGPPENLDIGPAERERVILFAGKLAPYKGLDLLLDAWAQISDLEAELRIVGSGPLEATARSAAQGDSRITWTGHIANQDMPAQFAAARAVVVPSTWDEPFGRTAAEALAYGRPVITTGLGGLGEVVDAQTGWLTGCDPSAVADALRAALGSDEAVARRASAARARHARLFSPEATTATLLDIYETALRSDLDPADPGRRS